MKHEHPIYFDCIVYFFNIIGMVCEFIGMFYEENCPKILIKDEE